MCLRRQSEASRRHGTLVLPDDLTDASPFTARGSSLRHGKSKLLDIMFTLELARRIEGTGITANCLDPGFNVTGLGRELGFAFPLEKLLEVCQGSYARSSSTAWWACEPGPASRSRFVGE